jgi:myo-inositol-1(or 4)-monophosphatase
MSVADIASRGSGGQQHLAERLLVAQTVAREAGRLASRLLADSNGLEIRLKGPQDFVTSADAAVERFIFDRLSAAFPADVFLGEESHSGQVLTTADALWVIDPIDGTANYLSGRPEWCVSIGFAHCGRPAIGVVYHPPTDELFAAYCGGGATRNGSPVRVGSPSSMAQATIALEYSHRTPIAAHLAQLSTLLGRGADYRRNGSAALSLAYVADGRFHGYGELDVYIWDVLAGMVLVAEAGGWTGGFLHRSGLALRGEFYAAAPSVRDAILAIAEA